MAKWGEGDARWIVDDKGAAGRNVGGWHWEEKNMLSFVRERAEKELLSCAFDGGGTCSGRVTSVKEVKGEAALHTRKGNKKMAVYDLSLTLCWQCEEDDQTVTGELKVSDFASSNDDEEVVHAVTVTGKGDAHERLKAHAQAALPPLVVRKLHAIIAEMSAL